MKPTSVQAPLPDQQGRRGLAPTPGHPCTGRRISGSFGSLLMWYFLAALFHACSGQNAPGTAGRSLPVAYPDMVAGDTVPGLSDAIMVVFQDQKNNYWFGSRGQGVFRYDGRHHLEFPPNALADQLHKDFPGMNWSPYGIYSLYRDRKGHVWFGTSNLGIYRFDGTSLEWMYEKHLTDIEETGGSFGIRIITPDGKDLIYFMSAIEDDDGRLWMVTYAEGVWQYDGKNVTPYPVWDGNKAIKLFSIYKDHQGDLWLGTHEAGVYKFNGKTFEQFKP